jgi:hypothetical protein
MRKTIIILSGSCIVLLLGYSAFRGYEVWKQNHWMALARQFAAKADVQNEFLCLEQALLANSRNLEACRMMANLAEAEHSSSALTWRKRALEIDPNSLDDRLALAQSAMFAHDLTTATSVLAGTDSAGAKTAPYFNVAGELALAMNRPDVAESDFAEAARLDPSNPDPLLSSAVLQLHSTNALDMAEARITLQRIILNVTNVVIRSQAQRELIIDAMRYQDYATALPLSRELAQSTNAAFADKLLWLDALKASGSGQYNSALAACEREAANNPNDIQPLTLWLVEKNLPIQALGWLRSLPVSVQTNLPAALLIAQCETFMQDWTGLQNSASKQDWGKLEYTRHALLSHALRQQDLYGASKAEWDVALKSANGRDADLTSLYRLAAQWNWPDEAQQILWSIVNSYPQEQWAARELASELYAAGGTRSLMQLFSVQTSRNPSDLDAKNNLALAAMLLRASEMNPYDLAREVHQKVPTNSNYACTYAYALYLQGQNAEALKLMQQLPSQALQDNSTAGYYGLILKAAGDRSQAGVYLRRAIEPRGQLLPEERAMFQQAMADL